MCPKYVSQYQTDRFDNQSKRRTHFQSFKSGHKYDFFRMKLPIKCLQNDANKICITFTFTAFRTMRPGRVAQSVTCLATDACLTADPGVASSIPARYHTFVEIDHEIISTVILLPSADLFKKGCCQLQAKVCAQITGKPLAQACPGKSVVK